MNKYLRLFPNLSDFNAETKGKPPKNVSSKHSSSVNDKVKTVIFYAKCQKLLDKMNDTKSYRFN